MGERWYDVGTEGVVCEQWPPECSRPAVAAPGWPLIVAVALRAVVRLIAAVIAVRVELLLLLRLLLPLGFRPVPIVAVVAPTASAAIATLLPFERGAAGLLHAHRFLGRRALDRGCVLAVGFAQLHYNLLLVCEETCHCAPKFVVNRLDVYIEIDRHGAPS